jgi:hypothetical membrane protein
MAAVVISALLAAAGDIGLAVVCWRTRTALGAIAVFASTVLLALAALSGWQGTTAADEVIGALVFLIVGAVLFCLGQTIGRLLNSPPEGDGSDAAPAP